MSQNHRRKTESWLCLSLSLCYFPGCLCEFVWRVQTTSHFLVPEDSVWTGCTGSCWDHTGSPVHAEITASAAVPLTATRCCSDQTYWTAAVVDVSSWHRTCYMSGPAACWIRTRPEETNMPTFSHSTTWWSVLPSAAAGSATHAWKQCTSITPRSTQAPGATTSTQQEVSHFKLFSYVAPVVFCSSYSFHLINFTFLINFNKVVLATQQISRIHHQTGSCCNSTVHDWNCTKLHTFDKLPV